MGKVNVCLKRTFFAVTSLIGIVVLLLLAFTLFSHGYLLYEEMDDMHPYIVVMYIFSILTLLLVVIGLYGAWKEKQWALILFGVGMIFSIVSMIVSELQGRTLEPNVAGELKKHYLNMLPLATASETFLDELNESQMIWHCCGVDMGYPDWGYDIPESCVCSDRSDSPCVAAPRNSSLYQHTAGDAVIAIYSEPCLPYLVTSEMMAINIGLGIFLGILLLWVTSAALCIAIICQLNRKVDTPTVVYSQEAKAGNYIVLSDAAENT
ncbi:tetraspanin-8-like [Brachionichthys hirsutus]|uniref:tetraspanin-8-like n=1 Tax=Brachionichthys hirsutus TaxID=412623 RepID=UPI0036050EEF